MKKIDGITIHSIEYNGKITTEKKGNPIRTKRTMIKETNKALKGFTTSYEISINNNKDPLIQLQDTRKEIEIHIEKVLNKMKGLKFIETLKITLKKQTRREEKTIKSAYFNSIAQTVINKTQIELALKLSKQQILNKVAHWISEESGWVVLSVDNHYLNPFTPVGFPIDE